MPAPLDLDQLQTFVAIADSGSFTRAAEEVFRTQSAVSMQMRRLEERIGKPLFEKDGRTWELIATHGTPESPQFVIRDLTSRDDIVGRVGHGEALDEQGGRGARADPQAQLTVIGHGGHPDDAEVVALMAWGQLHGLATLVLRKRLLIFPQTRRAAIIEEALELFVRLVGNQR